MDRATSDAILLPAPGVAADYSDLIGKPFRINGRGPDAYDCYGLVGEMERRAGRCVPPLHSPSSEAEMEKTLERTRELWTPCQRGPGAVLTFRIGRYVTHVGVMLDDMRFIHCTGTGNAGVMVERLIYWEPRIVNVLRYIP